MDGILVVDKPVGPTSFDVVRKVRSLGRGRKAGHTGTLDPLASGVLPICLGDATKIAQWLTEGDKAYEGVIQLGSVTDTWDSTGQIVEERGIEGLDPKAVERAVAAIEGEYWQTPPMYSAVKVGGRRLYELAREGEEIERRPRKVRVNRIELRGLDPRTGQVTVFVDCSKGTYVRSIAHEIGEALGTGGHLLALRRVRSGPFRIEQALPLERILSMSREELSAHVVPMREALSDLPELICDATRAQRVAQGRLLGGRELGDLPPGRLRLTAEDGRLLALGERTDGAFRYVRVFVTPKDLGEVSPNGR